MPASKEPLHGKLCPTVGNEPALIDLPAPVDVKCASAGCVPACKRRPRSSSTSGTRIRALSGRPSIRCRPADPLYPLCFERSAASVQGHHEASSAPEISATVTGSSSAADSGWAAGPRRAGLPAAGIPSAGVRPARWLPGRLPAGMHLGRVAFSPPPTLPCLSAVCAAEFK